MGLMWALPIRREIRGLRVDRGRHTDTEVSKHWLLEACRLHSSVSSLST